MNTNSEMLDVEVGEIGYLEGKFEWWDIEYQDLKLRLRYDQHHTKLPGAYVQIRARIPHQKIVEVIKAQKAYEPNWRVLRQESLDYHLTTKRIGATDNDFWQFLLILKNQRKLLVSTEIKRPIASLDLCRFSYVTEIRPDKTVYCYVVDRDDVVDANMLGEIWPNLHDINYFFRAGESPKWIAKRQMK